MKGRFRMRKGVARAMWAVAVTGGLAIASRGSPAQDRPPPDMDRLVEYARCIRANGYPEFPDPTPDGRIQLRMERGDGARFEAAQKACRDKVPPGMGATDLDVTPERMQALLAFASCVRERGVKDFPDPSPNGTFEIGDARLDLSSPKSRQALDACAQIHRPGALAIRRNGPPR